MEKKTPSKANKHLWEACEKLDLEGMKAAVQEGADVNAWEDDVPLSICIVGMEKLAWEILYAESPGAEGYFEGDDDADDEKVEMYVKQWEEIQARCADRFYACMTYLLEEGALVNIPELTENKACQPLFEAFLRHNEIASKFLIAHGANVLENIEFVATDVGLHPEGSEAQQFYEFVLDCAGLTDDDVKNYFHQQFLQQRLQEKIDTK